MPGGVIVPSGNFVALLEISRNLNVQETQVVLCPVECAPDLFQRRCLQLF